MAKRRHEQAQDQPKRSPIPLYVAAAVWVLYALFSPVYQYPDFIILALASFFIFIILYAILPSHRHRAQQVLEQQQAMFEAMPQVQADRAISYYKEILQQLNTLRPELFLRSPDLCVQTNLLEKSLQDSIRFLGDEPTQTAELTQFTDRYLSITIEYLQQYLIHFSQDQFDLSALEYHAGELAIALATALDHGIEGLYLNGALEPDADHLPIETHLKQLKKQMVTA